MRTRVALSIMAMIFLGFLVFMGIFVAALQRADDTALAARLSVVAQDIRTTIEARARLGLKLRYMIDLQATIERERATSPGLAAITIRSDDRIVLFSTDRVTVGDEAHFENPPSGWTHIGAHAVTVGLPVLNSFAERLGDVEVSALRGGLDMVHLRPMVSLIGVAGGFLLLASALTCLGSVVLLQPLQVALLAVTADAARALGLLHNKTTASSRTREIEGEQAPLLTTSREILGLIQNVSVDIARLDEAEDTRPQAAQEEALI